MPGKRRVPWALRPKAFLFAAGVGIIGGLVGTLFQMGRSGLQHLFMGRGGSLIDAALGLEWWQRFLLPVTGSIAAALLAYGLTRRRRAQGMADVMEAVTLKQAEKLSIRGTISRALSSLALIATGGSVGREGPIVYLSASIGTVFARLARISSSRLGLFSGCGVAAGLSAAYYAPFGAALFAMEVVLGNFSAQILGLVVVASVTANLVVQGFAEGPFVGWMKPSPLYHLPTFPEIEPLAYLMFLLLGIAAAFTVSVFIKSLREGERLFSLIPVSPLFRLPMGGVLLGVISISMPHVWGGGHDAVNFILQENVQLTGVWSDLPLWEFILLLLVAKIVATSITIGAGGSGGLFTPNILVGTCVGMAAGLGAQALAPGLVGDARVFGVVGMAAGLAAATQAPIMAVFFLAEMTQETQLLLPLVLACLAASVTARHMGLDSIYIAPLRRRGVQIPEGIEETALMTTRVRDIMREGAVWVRQTASFDMIVGMVRKARKDSLYVVDDSRKLLGVIRLHDIKNHLADRVLGDAVIAADLTVSVPTAAPEQTLAEILEYFDDPELHELAVVDAVQGRIVGVVDRRDLLTALSVEVLHTHQLRAKFVEHEGAQHYVELRPGYAVSRIPAPKDMVGRSLADANFRARTGLTVLTIVHSLDGRETRIQPEPTTIIHEKDALIVMGPIESIRQLGGRV
jgi:CIC family chloride channel protein